jgi:Sulfotransferase family
LNKFFLNPLKQRLSTLWVTQDDLETWSKEWKFFFILGFGRSGTAFMANLLNQAQEAYVFHEPVIEDFYAHLKAHYNQTEAKRYMQGFRKKEIYFRTRHMTPGVYGEVNGNLRCHSEAIRLAFPNAALLHLVRDGRDVVRSAMPRRVMTIRNPLSLMIHPEDADPWKACWHEMDRFARICWYWQEENRRLRTAIGKTVQFEQIVSSYEYFARGILDPCAIQIGKEAWATAIATPQNTTREFSMPKWDQWTSEQQKTFREICEEEMVQCGYGF